jgi:hypothetical protein
MFPAELLMGYSSYASVWIRTVGAEEWTDEKNGVQMRFLKDISEYIMVNHKTKVLDKDRE